MTRPRVLLLVFTAPIAAWAALVTLTLGMAALYGSDTVIWALLGGASGTGLLLCVLVAVRLKTPTLWSSIAVLGISALLTAPGTMFLYVLGKNPP